MLHICGWRELHTGLWWENLEEGDHLEDLDLRWEDNIERNLKQIGWECMEWINLAQDGNKWQAVVSMVMNRQML